MVQLQIGMCMLLAGMLLTGPAMGESDPDEPGAVPTLVSVQRIWNEAPHNAFTSLIFHHDRWYCAFREGKEHVCPDGALRVLSSDDGDSWESLALLRSGTADLRDAQVCVTPAGEIMLSGAAALHDRSEASHQTMAWFSSDGREWSTPVEIGDPDFWLWRVTWHKDTAYAIGYATSTERMIRLYASQDGRTFETLVENLFDAGYPNESSLVFLEDDSVVCLLRRDGTDATGQLGFSAPPYTEWRWKDLGVKIGGPQMIRIPDGRLVAGVRLYDNQVRTALCWIDPETGTLEEFLALPSGGDTSYPGLVWHNDALWMSYYSSHEGQSSIYLAHVRIP